MIVFGKKFRSIDIGLVDSTVFKLRTDPPLQFNWTACCATENAITLRLKFEEPQKVLLDEEYDDAILQIKFLNTSFFVETENYVRLISQDFTLKIPIGGSVEYTAVKEVPESTLSLLLPGTLVIFVIVNIIGFYQLEEHQNIVWLQIEFIQIFSLLGLLIKCEERLESDDFAVLFDLGSFVRLDFANFFIKSDPLNRQGENRFALFGY